MKKFVFKARLEQHPGLDATYVEFPYDVREEFGTRGQVKVKAWIDGVYYRGSLANMGTKCHTLIVVKDIRNKIGKAQGEIVGIVLEKDTEERLVTIPADLLEVLKAKPDEENYFNNLSYTHKKEYVQWIESAKKDETRKTRIAKTIEMIHSKLKK